MREYCVYCGRKIDRASKEHVIQNALGGLLESAEICCGECNNYISKKIDVPFTSIFNGVICNIPNLIKTNKKKSKPSCKGKACYKGNVYDVWIKDGKVSSCPELSKELKGNLPTSDFEILEYDFPINNRDFVEGIRKIAFNFALSNGIPLDKINSQVIIDKEPDGKILDIHFNYFVLPFYPLNSLENYLELETKMELYHNLILFSQGKRLWCYIDLFNTFQYYILLSEEWNPTEKAFNTYLQLLQKLDREIPDMYLRKPKHILIYADYYNIEPCLDIEKFKKRVANAIRLEPAKKSLSEMISPKLQGYITYIMKKHGTDKEQLILPLTNVCVYFDEHDKLMENQFRTVTLLNFETREITSYPELIKLGMESRKIDVRDYTFKKFYRLNTFLVHLNNIGKDDELYE